MRFENESTILLVGEGNFSFTLSLITSHGIATNRIWATCFQLHEKLSVQAQTNASTLISKGVTVHFGVDATELHSNPSFQDVAFDVVVFNFPHIGGKMKICKNRELLRRFFESASKIISDQGKILVTLCQGQGGTPADLLLRHWNDTWQVVPMATYGGLVLRSVENFDPAQFPGYECSGFRSLEKGFHTTGALTHTFQKQEFSLNPEFVSALPSLHPPSYSHDLSLWKGEIPFEAEDLVNFLLSKFSFVVQSVTLVDEFVCPVTSRQSYCYRIVYSSPSCALSPPKAFWLHTGPIADALKLKFYIVIR